MYARGPLWTLQFAAVLAIASAASIPASRIFERDGTCAKDFTKCSQAGLPDNFCCPATSTCNVLAGNTTILCCPKGGNCSIIQPISCDISLQDPKAHPDAAAKTTVLNQKLPTCATGCCPFGYSCDADTGGCVIDKDQSKKPGSSSSTSSTSSASSTPIKTSPPTQPTTSTASTTSTGTASAAPAESTSTESSAPPPSSTASKTLNTAAIVGGVVGALLGISLIAAGVWVLRHKRKKAAEEREKRDSPAMSFGHIISAPIPHADYHTQRLDFLAKARMSNNTASQRDTVGADAHDDGHGRFPPNSPYSPYTPRPNSTLTDSARSHHASAEVGGLRSLTGRYSGGSTRVGTAQENPFLSEEDKHARGERLHSGGSHSINVFADPSTVASPSVYNSRDTTYTTWTEFQHHADNLPSLPNSPLPPRRQQ
ncbi:hypothetical protein F4777DRAFT_580495 [Nemania sp. FL0916]|nr:hypothetical protein F4777DRAFT_580495 [Nemania sp. FL0916]